MSERGNSLSRNPNVCSSCSSMADGMEQLPREVQKEEQPVAEESPQKFILAACK
jgi:hypothetical protein